MIFRVTASIRHLTGVFAGLDIPGGYTVTHPTRAEALHTKRWIEKHRTEPVHGIAGRKYVFTSEPVITKEI
jgi:hypothetical protein